MMLNLLLLQGCWIEHSEWLFTYLHKTRLLHNQKEMTIGGRRLLWCCEGSAFLSFLGQESLSCSYLTSQMSSLKGRKHFLYLAYLSGEHFKVFAFILMQNKDLFYVCIIFLHRWILVFCSAWCPKSFLVPVFVAAGLIFHGPGGLKEENKLCQSIGTPRRKLEDFPTFKKGKWKPRLGRYGTRWGSFWDPSSCT